MPNKCRQQYAGHGTWWWWAWLSEQCCDSRNCECVFWIGWCQGFAWFVCFVFPCEKKVGHLNVRSVMSAVPVTVVLIVFGCRAPLKCQHPKPHAYPLKFTHDTLTTPPLHPAQHSHSPRAATETGTAWQHHLNITAIATTAATTALVAHRCTRGNTFAH